MRLLLRLISALALWAASVNEGAPGPGTPGPPASPDRPRARPRACLLGSTFEVGSDGAFIDDYALEPVVD